MHCLHPTLLTQVSFSRPPTTPPSTTITITCIASRMLVSPAQLRTRANDSAQIGDSPEIDDFPIDGSHFLSVQVHILQGNNDPKKGTIAIPKETIKKKRGSSHKAPPHLIYRSLPTPQDETYPANHSFKSLSIFTFPLTLMIPLKKQNLHCTTPQSLPAEPMHLRCDPNGGGICRDKKRTG